MSQINFVAEFRAIMETCRRDSVPGRTRLLWIALFYLANDRALEDEQTGAWEWPDEFFPVNNAELATHCPLEKRALLEARNRLKQMGVIDFKDFCKALREINFDGVFSLELDGDLDGHFPGLSTDARLHMIRAVIKSILEE